ncbi:MAG: hypothetical protein LBE17_02335 [Treponema sp.]|jgi:hypothetical protein|nr:hypothetical protein [Treponema sp.]
MKYLWPRFFCRRVTAFVLSALVLTLLRAAASPVYGRERVEGISARLVWTGSWSLRGIQADEDGGLRTGSGSLTNRGDLQVNALDLTARFQALDKRPSLFWEQPDAGLSGFSGGLYHNPTGSRLLYGVLDEWGLSARLRNPWGKSLPFAEARRPLTADLKAEISSTRPPATESETYLYLGSPRLGKFRAFASVQTDMQRTPAFGSGVDLQFARKTSLRAEGFYTQQRLAPSYPSTWFSFPPPLPERDFRLGGVGLFVTTPRFGAAFDGAYSQTFAWGRDMYGNLALRFGDKPWQASVGAEAAGSRFVDRDGNAVGAGFRAAARLDRKGKGASLFRAGLTLKGPGIGEALNQGNAQGSAQGSAQVSYRFPSSLKFPLPLGLSFRPGRVRLAAARDSRNRETRGRFDAGISFSVGPVRTAFNTAVIVIGSTGRASRDVAASKISGELSYYTGPFQFRTTAGYTGTRSKSPVWDLSWYMSIRGTREPVKVREHSTAPGRFTLPGRFSITVSSPDFPEKWACEFSWRLEVPAQGRRSKIMPP